MTTVIGFETNCVHDVEELLKVAEISKLEFLSIPLFHPRFRAPYNLDIPRNGPSTRSDTVVKSSCWISNFVGRVSEWIDLDNISLQVREISEKRITIEVSWMIHLGLQVQIRYQSFD